jgi:hypothetical protein
MSTSTDVEAVGLQYTPRSSTTSWTSLVPHNGHLWFLAIHLLITKQPPQYFNISGMKAKPSHMPFSSSVARISAHGCTSTRSPRRNSVDELLMA